MHFTLGRWPISGGTLSQDVASTKSGWGRVYWSHTKRTALFCCRTWPRPPWAHKPPAGLLAAHERNGAVLLQNAAPTPLSTHEHSRVHFSILTPPGGDLSASVYWSHTKRTALFCCRTWPRPPWAHKPPDGLLAAHERNGAVLLQNAAPTPFEHTRALEGPFSKLGLAGLVVLGLGLSLSYVYIRQYCQYRRNKEYLYSDMHLHCKWL